MWEICSHIHTVNQGYQAYFGAGTKLTVLDPKAKITPPAVKVLGPNLAEKCKNGRVTVVCVATDFYPDHVEVFWQINGLNQIEGVATDNAARKKSTTESSYKISSRLTTTYKEWNEGSQYTCTVTFFNGTTKSRHSDSVTGPQGLRGQYLKNTRITMLAYGIFICKSFVYGLFIMFIIKRQGFISK